MTDPDGMRPEYDVENMPGFEQGHMYRHVQNLKNQRELDPDSSQPITEPSTVRDSES